MSDYGNPWKGGAMKRFGVLLVVCAALAAAGCSSSAKSGDSPGGPKSVNSGSKTAASEVKISSCLKDSVLGYIDIKGTAHNDTSKRSDFSIELAITDATGATQLGTTIALAENFEPNQTAQWDAPSAVTGKPGAICKVSTVTRTASL